MFQSLVCGQAVPGLYVLPTTFHVAAETRGCAMFGLYVSFDVESIYSSSSTDPAHPGHWGVVLLDDVLSYENIQISDVVEVILAAGTL